MPGVSPGSTLGLIHVTVGAPLQRLPRQNLPNIWMFKQDFESPNLPATVTSYKMRKAGPLCPLYMFFPLDLCFFLVCMQTLWFTQNLPEPLRGALVLSGRAAQDILNQDLLRGFITCADKQTQENRAFQCSITF